VALIESFLRSHSCSHDTCSPTLKEELRTLLADHSLDVQNIRG
jgi:hypothetical protein